MDRSSIIRDFRSVGDCEEAVFVRVVAMTGFGGRESGEILLISNESKWGRLFGDDLGNEFYDRARQAGSSSSKAEFFEWPIGDSKAVELGLACGGVATIGSHIVSSLPLEFLDALARRIPVTLVTGGEPQKAAVIVGVRNEVQLVTSGYPVNVLDRAKEVHSRSLDFVERISFEGSDFLIESYAPPSLALVVGTGTLARAVESQFRMVGMEVSTSDSGGDALEIAQSLGPNDALILLSHDHDLTTPIATAVLETSLETYIGSLGSRHTQQERRKRLANFDLSASFFGPVGFDLGSRTPSETALAICAEFLAYRNQRAGRSLRDTQGPING
ncbi:MAG: hypothetical protein HKL83_02600 [Acidimicrobiaceae bacterium]|nr:hypothetical protein [Acidimicrobiaceae bacterium]